MLSNRDKAELGIFPNYILNGGAESGTAGWLGYNDTQTFTVTIASPAVFTVGSTTGFYLGMPIIFTTTGALPTGLTSGTTYYISAIPSGTTFRVSSTLGGSDVNTSGTQSGTHTARPLVPIDGTGGSLSGLTFSSSTSTPLIGNESLQIVQSNSTLVAGQGISYDFNIDRSFQAQVLRIQMSFNASSTFFASSGQVGSDSDLKVFIYDVTNAILIPVSPAVFLANGSNNFLFQGIFQTSSNSTSYRLCIHASTANANATGWTFKWDGVSVGPQPIVQGPPVTDWSSYTMTITGTSSNPTLGTNTKFSIFRRVGDSIQVIFGFDQSSAGSAGNGNYLFNLPPGLSIDTTKLTNSNNSNNLGDAYVLSSAGEFVGFMRITLSGIVISYESAIGTVLTVGSGFSPLSNTNVRYAGSFTVPITGWSSSTLMSNEASTRVVAAQYYESTQHATSTTQPINYDTQVYDTHGAVTPGSSWKFTAPVSGFYRVYGVQNLASANTSNVNLYKNGALYTAGMAYVTNTQEAAFCIGVQLNAGEFIDIRTSSSVNTNTVSRASFINIEQILGPSNIAALDSINARYYASSTSISSSLATVVWTTKDYDSTNSMASGIYTCPVAGKYSVTASLALSGTFALNNTSVIEIQKNGAAVKNITHYIAAAITNDCLEICDDVNCLAGDLIRIQVSNSGTSPAIVSSNTKNVFSIFRSGN